MPIYHGNYAAPVWVNGAPPTIGESELNVISGVLQAAQTIQGSGAPTTQTVGVVGQFYADISTTPPTLYRCCCNSDGYCEWELSSDAGENLAQEYDSTATYELMAYCLHDGYLYISNTEISTAEAWTSAHWTQVQIAPQVQAHKEDTANPHEVTAAQIGLGNVENVLQYSADNPAVKLGTITLSTSWTTSGGVSSQTVTVTGASVTGKSLVRLTPTPAQEETMAAAGVGIIYVSNNEGTLTAWTTGTVPNAAMTVRCLVKETQTVKAYLEFQGDASFTLDTYNNTKIWPGTMESSTDGATWSVWDGTTTLTSGVGNSLYLRGTGNSIITAGLEQGFSFGGAATSIECNGDMEMLRDYQTIARGESISDAADFCCLFVSNTKITKAPRLSAHNIRNGGYFRLFEGTSITEAPELPATSLSSGVEYQAMFAYTPLTKPPRLPATVLGEGTYADMFKNCTSLASLSEIHATNIPTNCCLKMYQGCTGIKISTTQSSLYKTAYRLPASGTGTAGTGALSDMFGSTGGSFTGTPTINTTYYTSNTVV